MRQADSVAETNFVRTVGRHDGRLAVLDLDDVIIGKPVRVSARNHLAFPSVDIKHIQRVLFQSRRKDDFAAIGNFQPRPLLFPARKGKKSKQQNEREQNRVHGEISERKK